MVRVTRVRMLAAMFAGLLLVAACGDDDDTGTTASEETQDSDTVADDSDTAEGEDTTDTTAADDAADAPDADEGDAGPEDGGALPSAGIGTVNFTNADQTLDVISCFIIEDDGGGVSVDMSLPFEEGLEVSTDGTGAVIGATDIRAGATATSVDGSMSDDFLSGNASFDGYEATFSVDTTGCG